MTPMGVFFTAIFLLKINEQALCQQPQYATKNMTVPADVVLHSNNWRIRGQCRAQELFS